MDPAPVWGGEQPEKNWKEYHQNLQLWLVEAKARLPHALIGKRILDLIPIGRPLGSEAEVPGMPRSGACLPTPVQDDRPLSVEMQLPTVPVEVDIDPGGDRVGQGHGAMPTVSEVGHADHPNPDEPEIYECAFPVSDLKQVMAQVNYDVNRTHSVLPWSRRVQPYGVHQ